MAEVSLMKNGSWLVFWECDVAENRNGSTSFQCTGRKPMFTLTYTYTAICLGLDPIYEDALSADLKTVETNFSEQDYPVQVTALFDGMAMEIKPLTRGQWDTVQWPSHLLKINVFNSHARTRKPRLTLILDFPPLAVLPVIRQFASLLDNQIMADVKFIIKDKEMAAHAAILASASPVMAAMFEPEKFKEGQSRTVEITDIEPEVFQQLLRYVYTGNAPLLQEDSMAEHLLIAANKYQMDKMKAECERTLIGKITLDNAVKFLVTAHLHLAPNLKEACIQCLVKHRIEVWNHLEWYQLNKSCNDLFIEASQRMCKDQV